MKNYVKPGKIVSFVAPVGGVTSGDFVVVSEGYGVATEDADAGDLVPCITEGVVELVKPTGETWAPGDLVYWDATGGHAQTTSGVGFPVIGIATEATASAVLVADVKLGGGIVQVLGT